MIKRIVLSFFNHTLHFIQIKKRNRLNTQNEGEKTIPK
ncbi:Hypothetical protein Eab7_0586 [Exiguobacterium antarcticum B7]|nr:Hypothetical protein Eab7_0586 [Exiguobacterium antarcticum B7]